jgi:arylsulfatase A-like enzyme
MGLFRRVIVVIIVLTLAAVFSQAQAKNPNVVIIYGDDVGYGDVGAYGAKMIPTPNIDRLAKDGLMFIDGHCSASTCTPSRYTLLTGQFAFRKKGTGILSGDAKLSISTDQLTLAGVFKKAGYKTAVIGKWHLGLGDGNIDWNGDVKPGPLEIGFDYSFLLPATNDRVPCVYLEGHRVVNLDPKDPIKVSYKTPLRDTYPVAHETPEAMTYYKSSHGHNNSVINGIGRIGYMSGGKAALWDDETMADVLVERTREYIAEHKDEPFFLYYSSQDIHVPRVPHPRFHGKSQLGYRGDAMVQLDWATGEIMKALEKNGLTKDTIVIFTSDNGPVYDDGYHDGTTVKTSTKESDRGHDGSGVYRGGKYQVYEGGTRVPLIVRWPAKVRPGVSKALFSQVDMVASFASMLDVKLEGDAAPDSRNQIDALLGKDDKGSDFIVEQSGGGLAIRKGKWKYIEAGKNRKRKKVSKPQLYNLDKDISEQNNVIEEHSDTAKELAALLKKVRTSGRIRNK